jgi:CubicO group peptidase (beta-lactamase class C family)
LLLKNGKWNNKQIISEALLSEALQKQTGDPEPRPNAVIGFGYHIWVPTFIYENDSITVVRAAGNGGQNIYIDKKQKIVTVITAGNYNNWQIRKSPSAIYMDFVYPAIIK